MSKIARVVDIFSHRLQVQERMTLQIKRVHSGNTEPTGSNGGSGAKTYVYADARCGKTEFYYYYFQTLQGAFNQAKTREEFMNLIQHGRV